MNIIVKIITTACVMFFYTLMSSCSNIPTEAELKISPYDSKPDIESNIYFPPGMQGGDSIVVCLKHPAELGNLEFAHRLSLTDYTGTTIYTSFDIDNKTDTLVFRNLSDNIKDQQWQFSVIGRYPGNGSHADTLDYLIAIQDDEQSVQLSPSYILINPLIDSSFYLDINLDDIDDSILAGELCLCFDNQFVTCDSIVCPESDSLYYFRSGDGSIINFTQFDVSSDSITFDFAFANGNIDGLPGSGKVIRVYCIAKKPGKCTFSLLSGRLKDTKNNDVSVELTRASIIISYVEN